MNMSAFLFRLFSQSKPQVFLEISAEELILGVLHFQLHSDIVPKTCENFLQICEGSSKELTPKGKQLTYVGTKFHRIVPGFLCQGGDLTRLNGKGGWSIYGASFPDENFTLKHSAAGVLSMANQGPNTNSSQFFITFSPCPMLDGKHTVFGNIVKGLELLEKIQSLGTANGKPRVKVTISNSGAVKE